MTGAKEAVVTSLTEVGTNLTGIFEDVLPIALGIIGSVMVVTFGVKLFKKLTGRA